ncbi:hypothetical protein RGQ13_15120 [Thalassotalea psychrophila]|uniref:ParB/Sulfiredoxin domain-containing protein n=1 Tax=Thalassotalea psychrophila TaxID=3065647 RepID=A0ABY9TT10_9GAMM|nr:hypothetical protein RGQ13_15120 [Colwelliaceae bacterium SQ149]
MKPREFFPNMPDEVFEIWLAPLIEGKGWPFKTVEDDLQATNWRYVLGIDFTLRQWIDCTWELIDINLPQSKFTNGSISMATAIVGNAAYGKLTDTANVENTKERFQSCVSYIKEHGNIPTPIILTRINDGFSVMDGNHRLAAILFTVNPLDIVIKAWVANINLTIV